MCFPSPLPNNTQIIPLIWSQLCTNLSWTVSRILLHSLRIDSWYKLLIYSFSLKYNLKNSDIKVEEYNDKYMLDVYHPCTFASDRVHKCEMCGKQYKTAKYLKRHIIIHTGEKRYVCEICGMSFTHGGNLQNHSLTHKAEKPHGCPDCGKTFKQRGNLRRHCFLHVGVKPYKCNLCNSSFAEFGNLKRHTLVHSGEKPYTCTVCNKRFAGSSALKKHSIMVT